MNILYVAPHSDFSEQVADALRALGHSVFYVDDRLDYSLPRILRESRALWRMSRRISILRARSNRALQQKVLSSSVAVDMILAGKGMNMRPETLDRLHQLDVKTAVWFPDNAANEPYAAWVRRVGPRWTHFFSFDSAIVKQMPTAEGSRIYTLPFAVDPEVWRPSVISADDRSRYQCDVAFIGAPYPERVRLLSRVADRYDVRIWGWHGWKETPLAKLYRGPLNAAASAKVYALAGISVNTNVLPHAHGVNLKTFEICASGGFQLTDQCEDLAASFEIGKELDVFADADEFSRKIDYWLSQKSERDSVAVAGYARVLRDHTLVQRMRQLLQHISP